MRKVGRPSLFKPEYSDLARKFCLLGATNEELAQMFDVSITTLDRWIAEKPEFRGAIKEGRAAADAKVADRLFSRAMGYSHEAVKIFMPSGADEPIYAPYTERYPPDTTAAIFWLKNRRRHEWREKVEVEATHRHDPDSYTDEELSEIIGRRRSGRTVEAPSDPEKLH